VVRGGLPGGAPPRSHRQLPLPSGAARAGDRPARCRLERPERGIAEIAGIPADLLETFSTRRRQILSHLAHVGRFGPGAAQAACLATRAPKPPGEAGPTLRQRWAAVARAAGHQPATVVDGVLHRAAPPVRPPVDQLAQHLLGPAGLTAQATGFDRRDLLQALCQTLPAGLAVDRAGLESIAEKV
jgi:TrwC relaxase